MAFSIRGLLIAVAFVAVACAALKYAGPVWWTILSAAALLLFMGSTIVALVGKGERRARAIGCAACLAIYGVLVFVLPYEKTPSRGKLPTTVVVKPLVDYLQSVPNLDDTVASPAKLPAGMTRAQLNLVVQQRGLMEFAHLIWAMLFGFLGSWFAGFVYRKNQPSPQE